MQASARGFAVHAAAGLAVAFALSLAFWLALGVFDLAGFVIWSIVYGLIGAAIGHALRRIVVTLTAAAALRVGHFVVLVYLL
jgi:hypothetical protein